MAWQPLKKLWCKCDGDRGVAINPVIKLGHDELWQNDTYQVLVRYWYPKGWDEPGGDKNPVIKQLSIHRHDRKAVTDWRHLQQMKNEVEGEEAYGVEIYPPESRLVDMANEYHLFVWPEGFDLGLGIPEGEVTDDDLVDDFNLGRVTGQHKGRQRPWEEGLTTGRSPASAECRAKAKEEFGG